MKSKFVNFFICLTLLFTACKKDRKLDFTEKNIALGNNTIVEIVIPEATGNSEVASKINSAIQKHIVEALQIGDINAPEKTIEAQIVSFNNEFNTFKLDFPESTQKWEAQLDGEIMYESLELISMALTSYINTGGAHGNLVISFLNFNAQTGEELKNSDLISNIKAFKKVAQTYFNKEVKNKEDFIENTSNFELPANIGLNEEGVILLYNTFEIASSASGITEFIIPVEEVSNYLNYY